MIRLKTIVHVLKNMTDMKQKFGRKLDNNLMWYGTLPCCDVLFIEINSKIN